MTRTRRTARLLALGAGVLILLTACNPESQEVFTPGSASGFSTARFRYDGTVDAWIEYRVSGLAGYQARAQVNVYVPEGRGTETTDRMCASATNRTVIKTCNAYGEFPNTDVHQADADPPDTYWPAMLIRHGDQVMVTVHCSKAGVAAACPPGTTVTVHTVNGDAHLIGNQPVGDLAAIKIV